jgi:peptidoglycan/xylan/chitin deacetylase (PgdA/CDA1 family)
MGEKSLQSKINTLGKIVSSNLIKRGVYSKQTNKKFTILMYHGIDKKQDTRFNQRFFSKANFEKQVIQLKKHFNIITYSDLVTNNFSHAKPNVMLTFDDGYANNYHYALPVLEKYDAHALFFITGVDTLNYKILWADALNIVTHYAQENDKISISGIDFYFKNGHFVSEDLGTDIIKYIQKSKKSGHAEKDELINQLLSIHDFTKTKELDDYWQLMTAEQIHKTSLSKNITIGSHGFYHNNLGSLSTTDALNEVELSKNYLEKIIQKKVESIGFPDGSYTEELNDALYAAGFKKQFLVDYHFNDAGRRDFTYDRVGLYPFMGNTHQILHKILK